MIYLDHAATSWPKPPQVLAAMQNFLESAGGNPGRSGHRLSIEAGRIVYETREALAGLFGVADPQRVLFTQNATMALNTAILGLLRPGDRVVSGGMEHNAVMRPLRELEKQGVELFVVSADKDGLLDLAHFDAALKEKTRLVVLNHASNVTGTISPVAEIAAKAHTAGALILVDAAQSAGVLPIDMTAMGIDLLAFTGHKGLQGPPGTGGLVLADGFDHRLLHPLVRGGTGSRSEFEIQPDDLPDLFESGTANGVGIAGLGAGLAWLKEFGMNALRSHEIDLTRRLRDGLGNVPGVRLYGAVQAEQTTGIVSFTIAGRRVSEIGLRLDEEYGILCRVGLHCAPAAHRAIGTFPEGAVRLAVGPMTSREDIDAAIRAVEKVAGE
jgi:cysteine desulfurase/selenocysteine lyase